MARHSLRPAAGRSVLINLDDETNTRLLKARERSGRSKSTEVLLRIKDHLLRFPDFYNSEYAEEMPTQKK